MPCPLIGMIMPWMVIDLEEDDEGIHVVPSCWGGRVIPPHVLNYSCVCKPLAEAGAGDDIIYTHNDLNGKANV